MKPKTIVSMTKPLPLLLTKRQPAKRATGSGYCHGGGQSEPNGESPALQ